MPNPFRFDEDRVLVEQLRLVLGNFRSTFPVLLIPVLLYWSLANPSSAQSLRWWCAGVILSHLSLQLFTRSYFSMNIQPKQVRKIISAFSLLNLIDAVMWGSLSWLTLTTATQSGFVFVVAVFAGMLGGGLATLSPIPLLFIAFALPQAVMLSINLWTIGNATYTALSIGVLIYLITLLGQVFNSARAVRASILLHFELDASRLKLREIERQQTLDNERQRLMQDMHDGLGSTLIGALRVAERGNMDDAELASVLKGCIDDLKLAIDSMEPVDKDLLLLLATLRFRLGPRLESAGVQLQWQVENVPTLDWLDPRSALHILRILQEAIANIIKHTTSTEVHVATSFDEGYVSVTVADNGQGFDFAQALGGKGRGLSGQRDRAASIGADINWQSNHLGTCMRLTLPIHRI